MHRVIDIFLTFDILMEIYIKYFSRNRIGDFLFFFYLRIKSGNDFFYILCYIKIKFLIISLNQIRSITEKKCCSCFLIFRNIVRLSSPHFYKSISTFDIFLNFIQTMRARFYSYFHKMSFGLIKITTKSLW